MEMNRQWSSNEAAEVDVLGDMLAADPTIPQMPLSQAEDGEAANLVSCACLALFGPLAFVNSFLAEAFVVEQLPWPASPCLYGTSKQAIQRGSCEC